MTARTKTRIRELEEQVRRLTPTSGPGVLTSATTRGVSRRALRPRTAPAGTVTVKYIPCWG